jgi:hypothetical protein
MLRWEPESERPLSAQEPFPPPKMAGSAMRNLLELLDEPLALQRRIRLVATNSVLSFCHTDRRLGREDLQNVMRFLLCLGHWRAFGTTNEPKPATSRQIEFGVQNRVNGGGKETCLQLFCVKGTPAHRYSSVVLVRQLGCPCLAEGGGIVHHGPTGRLSTPLSRRSSWA